jgi:adenylate cyclase
LSCLARRLAPILAAVQRRRFPLRLKIAAFAAALVAVAVTAVAVSTVIVPWTQKLAAQDRLATDLISTAVPLSVEVRLDDVRLNASRIQDMVVNSPRGVPIVYALVWDAAGNLDEKASAVNGALLQSLSPQLATLCQTGPSRCLELLARGTRLRGLRAVPMKLVLDNGRGTIGRLELGISTLALDAELRRGLWRDGIVLLATLLLAVLGALAMGGRIARPLGELSWAMGRLELGDFDQRISSAEQAHDEVGDLARAFNNMAVGLKERERLRGTLGRYVSGDVADRILEERDDLSLRGELRHVTVLFLDVRGFTTVSEHLQPAEVLELLNEYFSVVVDRVVANGGTVNKFIGDAAMCLWGAPRAVEQPERSAVLCALEIQEHAARLSEDRARRQLTQVGFGIGINSGEAVAGNLGAAQRLEYTVIGDAVNLAQRLESHARPGEVLISESVYQRVAEWIETSSREPVKLKGKSQPVAHWEARRKKSVEAA